MNEGSSNGFAHRGFNKENQFIDELRFQRFKEPFQIIAPGARSSSDYSVATEQASHLRCVGSLETID